MATCCASTGRSWVLMCRARKLRALQNQAFPSSFFLHPSTSPCASTPRSESPLPSSTYPSFSDKTLEEPFQVSCDRVHGNYDPIKRILVESIKQAVSRSSSGEQAATRKPLDCLALVEPISGLVYSVIWELRDEWRSALMAFELGEEAWGRDCVDETTCELIVWILGNHNKFKVAWRMIRHMRQLQANARRILLIMIDRYAAAGYPGKAIRTFRVLDKFETVADEETYYALLKSLCKHGNVEEAEEFMLTSKSYFPLETKSFNIILDGWCNIWVDVLEAKRIWRNMAEHCITPDATTYTHMVSCFAKVGNLFDSVRLYHQMKKRSLAVSMEVYNALIYVLVKENCFREAHNLLEKMKQLSSPLNSATYISLIRAIK